jgi:hypothetical protein
MARAGGSECAQSRPDSLTTASGIAAKNPWHRGEEPVDRLGHDLGVVAVDELQRIVEELHAVAGALRDGPARHLRQLVVGEHRVDLAFVPDHQLGHPGQHPVAEVHPVDQVVAVDELMKDDVTLRARAQLREPLDRLQVGRVVMQVAGDQQAPGRREPVGASAADGQAPEGRRGGVEGVGNRCRVAKIEGAGHSRRISGGVSAARRDRFGAIWSRAAPSKMGKSK